MVSHKTLMVATESQALFSINLLAFAKAFPKGSFFLYLSGPRQSATKLIEAAAGEMGIEIVEPNQLQEFEFDEVLVHSWAHGESLGSFLESVCHHDLSFYADGLRPFFSAAAIEMYSPNSLIYFVYAPADTFLESRSRYDEITKRVVPLKAIRDTWRLIAEVAGLGSASFPKFENGDLFIVERYWGQSAFYQMWDSEGLFEIAKEVTADNHISRVIIKHDSRSLQSPEMSFQSARAAFGEGVEVQAFPEGNFGSVLHELDVLDFYFFNFDLGKFDFFGFDGTPNLVCGFTQPESTIMWVDADRLKDVFLFQYSEQMVLDTVTHQRRVIELFKSGRMCEVSQVQIDGSYQELVLSRLRGNGEGDDSDWNISDMRIAMRYIAKILSIPGNRLYEILDRFNEDQLIAGRIRAENAKLQLVLDKQSIYASSLERQLEKKQAVSGAVINLLGSVRRSLAFRLSRVKNRRISNRGE